MFFFDVQSACGDKVIKVSETFDVTELLQENQRLGIASALVHVKQNNMEIDFELANDRLFQVCYLYPQLIPCPIVVPNGGLDVAPEEEQVDIAIQHRAGAVYIRPDLDGWSLDKWCCDRLFKVLEDRRLPVYCPFGTVNFSVMAELAERYPNLPLICAEVDYRRQRQILPLLQTYESIYLSIGSNYCVFRGVEQLIKVIGVERLLFGTGFPNAEPMAAITMLMYALISDKEKGSREFIPLSLIFSRLTPIILSFDSLVIENALAKEYFIASFFITSSSFSSNTTISDG